MTIGVGFTALHTLPLLQLFLNLTLHLLLLAATANICQDLPSKFCYYHYHVVLRNARTNRRSSLGLASSCPVQGVHDQPGTFQLYKSVLAKFHLKKMKRHGRTYFNLKDGVSRVKVQAGLMSR